jgi:hypothetical protein
MKIKLTAEQKSVLAGEMKKIAGMSDAQRELFIARTIRDVYDLELPVAPVIDAIADFQRAAVGEHLYYMSPAAITKAVRTITSGCTITQTKVSPKTRTEVSWTDLLSEEQYVCIHDWLKGDHDILTFVADMVMEGMDRKEIYSVLALVGAGAVSESNVYTIRSGQTKFVYPDLVDMARSVAKYGSELVLITGGNITTDIQLLNYDADKNQAVSIFDVVSKHIPIEELSVTVDAGEVTVLDADVAYLVAVADAKKNRSLLVGRRQVGVLTEKSDTEYADAAKERVIISTGNTNQVGANKLLAKGFVGFEEFSATALNDKVFAQFTRE